MINDDSHPNFFCQYIKSIFFFDFHFWKKILTFALRVCSIRLVLSDPSHNMKKVGKKICTNHYKLWHFQPFFFTKCIEPKIRLDESFSGQGGQLNCGISILAAYELFIPFSIFVFLWFFRLKLRKCLFTFFKIIDCLALQTETIVKKITQPELPNELTKICNKPGIHLKQVGPKDCCHHP